MAALGPDSRANINSWTRLWCVICKVSCTHKNLSPSRVRWCGLRWAVQTVAKAFNLQPTRPNQNFHVAVLWQSTAFAILTLLFSGEYPRCVYVQCKLEAVTGPDRTGGASSTVGVLLQWESFLSICLDDQPDGDFERSFRQLRHLGQHKIGGRQSCTRNRWYGRIWRTVGFLFALPPSLQAQCPKYLSAGTWAQMPWL